MSFVILDPALHNVAVLAKKEITSRFNLRKAPLVEESIHNSISWRPTYLWKRDSEYLACEVANRPLPTSINESFADITSSGLPVRVIVAYPMHNSLSTLEYQKDMKKARTLGIGFLSVDEANNSAKIEYKGISSLLSIPSIDLSSIPDILRPNIHDAYDTYMNGDPKHGVQELGQIIEAYLKSLASQAQKNGKLTKSKYVKGKFYKLTKLIDELIDERIIDLGVLGNCRGFVYPRNDASHPADSITAAKRIERKYRENFIKGISILEDLPHRFKEKKYLFRK